jgi:hypothetical protein
MHDPATVHTLHHSRELKCKPRHLGGGQRHDGIGQRRSVNVSEQRRIRPKRQLSDLGNPIKTAQAVESRHFVL